MKRAVKKAGKEKKSAFNRGSHIVKSAGGSMDKGGKVPKSFKHYNPDTINPAE